MMRKKMRKKKALILSALCALQCNAFLPGASAEEVMEGELPGVVVEGEKPLPGGFVASSDRVGILGEVNVIDAPFTQKKYTQKTIEDFYDPNQPLNGVLANNPSIRIGSPSSMYTDFSMRGVNMNAAHYYINGIPNMFNQTRSIPAWALESVEIVSGPSTVLNGATFSNNGTNGTDAPAGMLNGVTKKATEEPLYRYTQRFSGRSTLTEEIDVGHRFGEKKEWGVRLNAHYEDGGLSMEGASVRDKSVYLNLDHKSDKSATNIFGGYFDWKVNGGQRWLSASGVKDLVAAPDGKNNLSFAGQTKYNHGYLFTLNHVQKFSDKWKGFANAGYNHYSEHKWDPNSGSLTLGDGGRLSGKFRDYLSHSQSSYWQIGVSNEAKVGNVKNNVSLAVDYFNYRSAAQNSGSAAGQTTLSGNLWNGVKIDGSPKYAASIDAARYAKEQAYALTLADRVEFGKASVYAALSYKDTDYTGSGATSKKISKGSLNPTFAVAYKPVDNLSVYASHAQAYTRPVEVAKDYVNAGEVFDPIKNKQTEIGVKYETGNMLHSLAVFQLDQASYMVEGDTSNPKDAYYTQNGKNQFRGIEYSLTGKVARKWSLMGGLMYLHGERKNTPDVTWSSGSLKPAVSKDGWYANGVPKWNAVLAAEYEPDDKITAIGRLNYIGKSHVNDNGVMAPAYMTVDLGLRYKMKFDSTPVTLSAMCYNVLGKDYWISRGTSVALGAPRTFMLSAQFDL